MTSGDTQEGTPEACGNGICDSIEKEKGLCDVDCSGASTIDTDETEESEKTTATSGENEITLDNTAAVEALDITLDTYDQIDELLKALQTLLDSAVDEEEKAGIQQEIDTTIAEIDALSDSVESNGFRVLHGTNQDILSASESYSSAGTPWQRLIDAVNNLEEGNQQVEFTYSFIIEGTEMENGESVELKDHEDESVSNEEFKQEIREGITAWEALFEGVFNTAHGYGGNLEVIFTDLSDETGTSTPSNGEVSVYEIPGTENLGDLRYGMESYDSMVTGTPFSPTGLPGEGESDSSGDVHYNSNIDWRMDDAADSATSVLIVTAHETGHGLAYQHEDDGLMAPPNIVRGSFIDLFPEGLIEDDAVVAATIALYGSAAQTAVQRIVLEDGSELELPAVNAATLGVSAIKVRSEDEREDAQERVAEARTMLASYKEDVETLKEKMG